MIKIVFDARVLEHGNYTGIENYTKYILKSLSTKVRVRDIRSPVVNKYFSHLYNHLLLPFKGGNILFCPANTAPLFVPKSKKLVITVHDVAFLKYPANFSKFFKIYYSILIPFNIKRADEIITISEASKREILLFFPEVEEKINIIPLGIDKKYKLIPSLKKKRQILYVGSINERKNLIGVIEAFELLSKELEYTLVIIGNSFDVFSFSNKMMETLVRAKENDKIIFKEGIDDNTLIYEYNVSTLLLFPSFYEGFGLPPLEAMACGTPVITSNLSSMPEVCGDAAIYCNPHDIEDIKNKIQVLLSDKKLQEQMIIKGFEHVKNFTWEKSAQKHIEVFEKALKS